MSSRAVPPELEAEVLAKHHEGLSLRGISEWLREEKRILASRESVNGVLYRNGVTSDVIARTEPVRQLAERADELTDQLFECLEYYPQLVEEALNPDTDARVSTALQAVKSWASLIMWSLRAGGAPVPTTARPPATLERELATAKEAATAALAPPPPPPSEPRVIESAASSPPRNQPCPCGSGAKWKKCCGAPSTPPLRVPPNFGVPPNAIASPLSGSVSG
jgi:hypothetical protein